MDTGQETTILALVEELKLNVNGLETQLDRALSRNEGKEESEAKEPMQASIVDEIKTGLIDTIKRLSFQNTRLQREILDKLAK